MISQILTSLFILTTLCLQNQVLSSPVLLWSNSNLPQSPVSLSTISPLNLISDYICKLTNEQIQLRIFAVNDLTVEDIQRSSQRDHSILLDAKKDKTNFRYFPNVAPDVSKTFSLLPRSNNMKCSHIHFQIASSNTYDSLQDALNTIEATIDKVGTNSDSAVVIALISGTPNDQSSSRRRRQADVPEVNAKQSIINNKTCMFYATNLYWNNANGTKSSGRIYNLGVNSSSCSLNTTATTTGNQSSVHVDLVWINNITQSDVVNLRLTTTIIGRYWYLVSATLNNNEYRYFAYGMYDRMDTPPTYSYVCTSAMFVRYEKMTATYGKYNFSDKFYLTDLQFQPFFGNGISFGAPNYCTSFFTSGIWMGVTSSLLCFAILIFGIHRIMMIKSNDRFDDPKGKPLIIKAQE